jgi:hypothetical protein
MVIPDGLGQAALVPSPSCGTTDLAGAYEACEAARRELACVKTGKTGAGPLTS